LEICWPRLVERRAQQLNIASWTLVRSSKKTAEEYRKGLTYAEDALRLEPDDVDILKTLGVAQYRSGKYQEAVATLMRCDRQRKKPTPADLAFLAMAQYRLGQKEQASATLQRLQQLMKAADQAGNRENQGFLREAEEIVSAKL